MSRGARQFTGDTLLIATHNPGKVPEIMALLPKWIVNVTTSATKGLPEPVEDGEDFLANAKIKALDAASRSGLVALADDSGLCINALGGKPAHHSARWAPKDETGKGQFHIAMQRALNEVGDNPDRTAYFVCELVLAWPDGDWECAEGRVYGKIAPEIRGRQGFGYDAIFIPDGHTKTFGEDPLPKDKISHRVDAFRKLNEKCFRHASASCRID